MAPEFERALRPVWESAQQRAQTQALEEVPTLELPPVLESTQAPEWPLGWQWMTAKSMKLIR